MKHLLYGGFLLLLVLATVSCGSTSPKNHEADTQNLVVAAASNLTDAFAEVGPRFTTRTGIRVVFSYGATAELAKQIENGAPVLSTYSGGCSSYRQRSS